MREPGLYRGIPNAEYHRGLITVEDGHGRSLKPLSSTGAKTLLTESPADYLWKLEHPVSKKAYDAGHAAHELILEGRFSEVRELKGYTDPKTGEYKRFENRMTSAAKEADKEIRGRGLTPMLTKELVPARGMASAVRKHPVASNLLSEGEAEVSALVWDVEYQVWLQVRFDWLRGSLLLDLKTDTTANPRDFSTKIGRYKYHLQASLYLRAAELLGIESPEFAWLVVQNTGRHAISVISYSQSDRLIGDRLMHQALSTYAQCMRSGEWPGYDNIYLSALPKWAEYEAEDLEND